MIYLLIFHLASSRSSAKLNAKEEIIHGLAVAVALSFILGVVIGLLSMRSYRNNKQTMSVGDKCNAIPPGTLHISYYLQLPYCNSSLYTVSITANNFTFYSFKHTQ